MTFRRKPAATLREAALRGIARALILLAAFVVGFIGAAHSGTRVVVMPGQNHHDLRILPTVNPTAELLREHGCWSGPAPADMKGKFPGHVVVTLRDGRLVYGGEALVGKALGQLFDGKEFGLVVHGFCR